MPKKDTKEECCDKCHDVYFEKDYPAHTAIPCCSDMKCPCHSPTPECKHEEMETGTYTYTDKCSKCGNYLFTKDSPTPECKHEETLIEEMSRQIKDNTRLMSSIKIIPSPRIDYCVACDAEHGYDCPKDSPHPKDWESRFDEEFKIYPEGFFKKCGENSVESADLNDVKSYIQNLLLQQRSDIVRECVEVTRNVKKNYKFNGDVALAIDTVEEQILTLIKQSNE